MHVPSYCERCDLDVMAEHRLPWIRKLAWVYVGFAVPAVVAFPFFAWDYVVSLPAFGLYMLGFIQVVSRLREKPSCSECGAIAEPIKRARA